MTTPPPDRLTVLPAEISDRDALYALHREARLENDAQISPSYAFAKAADGYYETYWRDALLRSDQTVLKATLRSGAALNLAGFAAVGVADAYDGITTEGYAELHQIYIAPSFQRQGIGHVLFDACIDQAHASGAKGLLINVLGIPNGPVNDGAIAFYQAQGAVQIGISHEVREHQGEEFQLACPLLLREF